MERLCSVSPLHQSTPGIGSRVEISSGPLSASTVVAMAIPQLLHVVLLRSKLQEVESDLEVMVRYLTDDEPPTAFRELYSKLCELGLDDADARFVYATLVSAYVGLKLAKQYFEERREEEGTREVSLAETLLQKALATLYRYKGVDRVKKLLEELQSKHIPTHSGESSVNFKVFTGAVHHARLHKLIPVLILLATR